MNLAAVLQILGATLITFAILCLNPVAGVLVAGCFLLGFGVWEEVSS